MARKYGVTITIDRDVDERVRKYAEKERRTYSNAISVLVSIALDTKEKKEK